MTKLEWQVISETEQETIEHAICPDCGEVIEHRIWVVGHDRALKDAWEPCSCEP